MPTKRQLCTFYLENLFLGIEVEKVQEVIRYQQVTPVPLAPKAISGLMNLRGQIVTVIDLRQLLETTARSEQPMNIVIHALGDTYSLLVDRVGDVLELTEESFEAPPDTLEGMDRELIRGTYKLPEVLLLTVDTEKLVSKNVINFETNRECSNENR